jgi:hypothetical protein
MLLDAPAERAVTELDRFSGINVASDGRCDPDQTDEQICADEVSDEALEATADTGIAFTLSILLLYCRFC